MSEKLLVKKLAKVMKEVKHIEKRGFNKFHQYKYATESDVAEKVREVLADQNVIMIPSMKEHSVRTHETAKGKTEYIATVLMEFTFMDGETGEHFSFCMAGEGQDAGDKAYYKAITGAQKYALMKAFMIPTGDDPEGDSTVDERNNGAGDKGTGNKSNQNTQGTEQKPITSKQVGLIKTLVKNIATAKEVTDKEVYIKLGFQDVTTLTTTQASKAIETLNKWVGQLEVEKQGA